MEEWHKFRTEQLEDLRRTRKDLLQHRPRGRRPRGAGLDRGLRRRGEGLRPIPSRARSPAARDASAHQPRHVPPPASRLEARPPGKKVKRLSLLSGSASAAVVVAFLAAPSRPDCRRRTSTRSRRRRRHQPGRRLQIYEELRERSSSSSTPTRSARRRSATLDGVTMRGDGVSAVISQRLRDAGRASESSGQGELRLLRVPNRPTRPTTSPGAPRPRAGATTTPTATSTTPPTTSCSTPRSTPTSTTRPVSTYVRCLRSAWSPRPGAATSARSASPSRSRWASSSTRSGRARSSTGSVCSRGRRTRRRPRVASSHVYVDNSRGAGARPVTPMPDVVREAVVRLPRLDAARGDARTRRAVRSADAPGRRRGCAMLGVTDSATSGGNPLLAIILMMTLGVLVAGAVAVYVAYPHRGEEMPVVPQLGDAMRKGVDSLPDPRGLRVPRLTRRPDRTPRAWHRPRWRWRTSVRGVTGLDVTISRRPTARAVARRCRELPPWSRRSASRRPARGAGSLERHRFLSLLLGVLAPQLRDPGHGRRDRPVATVHRAARAPRGASRGSPRRRVRRTPSGRRARVPHPPAAARLVGRPGSSATTCRARPDDCAAMREIARVLNPRGIVLEGADEDGVATRRTRATAEERPPSLQRDDVALADTATIFDTRPAEAARRRGSTPALGGLKSGRAAASSMPMRVAWGSRTRGRARCPDAAVALEPGQPPPSTPCSPTWRKAQERRAPGAGRWSLLERR